MKKKKRMFGPTNVPRYLELARDDLIDAFQQDEDLANFKIEFTDGHTLTLAELHTWLTAAIDHYEKNGPKAEAQKILEQLVRTQPHN